MAFEYGLRIHEPHRVWTYDGAATEAEIFDVTGGSVDFTDHPEGGRVPMSGVWLGDERGTYGPLEIGIRIMVRMHDAQVTTMPAATFPYLWTTYVPVE